MRVNFSVTNQLATPAIHAAALANRPPAGQPGRLFVDTDNPSSGIYRDTGTVWENITGGASAGNLQTVTDAGNTTDNNIELTFADNNSANKLSYYNIASAQIEYAVERRAPGITTNDCLVIESQKISSPSTQKIFGILLEPGVQRLFTYYDTAYQQAGLICNFSSNNYGLYGTANGTSLEVDDNNSICNIRSLGNVYIGDTQYNVNGTILNVDDVNQIIKTAYQGSDIGLKLDFANNVFTLGETDMYLKIDISNDIISTVYQGSPNGLVIGYQGLYYALGDYNQTTFGTHILIDNSANQLIKTFNNGNDVGLKLEFNNNDYYFGDYGGAHLNVASYDDAIYVNAIQAVYIGDYFGAQNGTIFGVLDGSQTLDASANLLVGTSGPVSGQHLKIRVGGTDYVIELKDP